MKIVLPIYCCILFDSYSLCRVFKKTIQIPKPKEEDEEQTENNNNNNINIAKKASILFSSEDQGLREDSSGINNNNNNNNINNKLLPNNCDNNASSSDLTQGTPTDDQTDGIGDQEYFQPQFASDEANSNPYSLAMDYSSNLFQEMDVSMYNGGMHYQLPYPPLELEDFPQINLAETEIKTTIKNNINDCNMVLYDDDHNKYRDCSMSGTLEEIISLCSSSQDHHNNSLPLSMLDN